MVNKMMIYLFPRKGALFSSRISLIAYTPFAVKAALHHTRGDRMNQ
jgi:hypothetical protein